MEWIAVIAALLVLALGPLFILFVIALKDLSDTRKRIKQNDKEIHEMIYGNKE